MHMHTGATMQATTSDPLQTGVAETEQLASPPSDAAAPAPAAAPTPAVVATTTAAPPELTQEEREMIAEMERLNASANKLIADHTCLTMPNSKPMISTA